MGRDVKVGLLVIAAFLLVAVAVFTIGEKNNLFGRKNTYFVRFEAVGGLTTGSPVQLNGVTVGQVRRVVLPGNIDEQLLNVEIKIDRRYAARVRTDSVARIKTLGLLGDKFLDITSGSAAAEIIPSGGEIPAAVITDMDRLLASSGDVMENVVAVSLSLRNILHRVEQGEGMLGALLLDTESAQETKDSVRSLVGSLNAVLNRLESGEGTLGRLMTDDGMGDELAQAVTRLNGILGAAGEGDGAISVLLNDPDSGERMRVLVASLTEATTELSALAGELRDADGLLPRLLNDKELGAKISGELEELIENLNLVSEKLNEGDGSLAMLLNDPGLYEAIDDILVGVDESKTLRWLIRSRQKSGIQERYEAEQQLLEEESLP